MVSSQAAAAPASRILFVTHVGAFFLLYFGIAAAVFGPPPRLLFPPQIVIGALLIAIGAVLSCWTLLYFPLVALPGRHRCRPRAGHRRALQDPAPSDLPVVDSARAWARRCGTRPLSSAVSFVIIAVLSDLRGRAEETLLLRVYGETYAKYCERTRRFIPAIY